MKKIVLLFFIFIIGIQGYSQDTPKRNKWGLHLLNPNALKSIQSYYPEGFEDWDFYVSWKNGTPNYYPESWFWKNYEDDVMALTYEDMNCSSAGNYDETAFAMLSGIADYLDLRVPAGINQFAINSEIQIYPNPVKSNGFLSVDSKSDNIRCFKIFDTTGKQMYYSANHTGNGSYELKIPAANPGMYILQMQTRSKVFTKKIIIKR